MKKLILLALLGSALPVLADSLLIPADAPASYKAECGSCHVAYPPALLAAGDWRRLMGGLDKHFGSDASLDAARQKEIGAFLERRAGNGSRLGRAGDPPRISQTTFFVREHDEVPARLWRDPKVKSAANCEACHRRAAEGRFGEHEISIPETRR